MQIPAGLRVAILDAWAVLSPVTCGGCGADDRALCLACSVRLTPRLHSQMIAVPAAPPLLVTSALEYDGPVRRAILALKEQARVDLARALGAPLREAVLAAVDGRVELATVPSSKSSYRARGFDPIALLIAGARMPRASRILQHVRATTAQKSLDREHRESNLVYSLRARHPLDGRSFLLVDDVVTTGATLIEAARAITAASGVVVAAATLAYTPRRFEPAVRGRP